MELATNGQSASRMRRSTAYFGAEFMNEAEDGESTNASRESVSEGFGVPSAAGSRSATGHEISTPTMCWLCGASVPIR